VFKVKVLSLVPGLIGSGKIIWRPKVLRLVRKYGSASKIFPKNDFPKSMPQTQEVNPSTVLEII
jgi:hypothetical protein